MCTNGQCAAPTCDDGVRNGQEPGVDCGAGCNAPCPTGSTCGQNADCVEGICTDGRCATPTCSDGLQNGGERSLDLHAPSSERVLDATAAFVSEQAAGLRAKPANLWRKLQIRREMGYYRLR